MNRLQVFNMKQRESKDLWATSAQFTLPVRFLPECRKCGAKHF